MVSLKLFALLSILSTPAFSLVIQPDARSFTPESRDVANANVDVKSDLITDGGRRMTNAERLAKGLGPLVPTRRSTASKARRSGNPAVNTESEEDSFRGPSVIRLRRPDGGEVGVITFPNGDDGDLVLFDPDTTRAQKFQKKGNGQNGSPFEIYPVDDGVFGGKTPLLAVLPRGRPSLGPGSPDFLHVGLAHLDDGGLLDIALPSRLLSGGTLGPLSSLTAPMTGDNGGLLNAALPDILDASSSPLGTLVPSNGNGDRYPAQSAVWTFDPKTRRLLAHYTNPSSGNTVPAYFVTGGPCQHLICLTADVEAFRNTYGGDALELHALVTVL